MDSTANLINKIGQKAKLASESLRIANTEQKNNSLISIAQQIDKHKQTIIDANNVDIDSAKNNNICLLYTSPSPRDGLLSRMPSSA